jgi:hypothetical protein
VHRSFVEGCTLVVWSGGLRAMGLDWWAVKPPETRLEPA